MRILLFGKNGQVGHELQRSLVTLGEVIALDRLGDAGLCGDLANLEAIRKTIQQINPDVIVNAAAYTAVDKAEEQQELAKVINSLAPAVIAEEAKKIGALLVHYSTDYVFNGEGETPWQESDKTAPLNYYGKTKLAGEKAIENAGVNYLIFRTSWVYANRGANFIASMQRLMQERESLSIVEDQIGAPTSAELIAEITAQAIPKAIEENKKCGLYHLAASGEVSWQGYALEIAKWLKKNQPNVKIATDKILPIKSSEYPTPAKRPLNSRLGTKKIEKVFDLNMPKWQEGVIKALQERYNGI